MNRRPHAQATADFDLEAALARVRGRGPAVVLMHDNPDPDSMAAAECLKTLLSTEAGLPVTIARGGIVGRAENRAMVRELALQHVPVESLDLSRYAVVALVDTQPETGNNSLPPGFPVDIVVDHHPVRDSSRRAPWLDVREDFGATATIAYSYLRARRVPVDARLATAVLYAIKSETRDLTREASPHEFAAYQELLPLVDFDKMYAITDPKVGAAYFAALDRALRAAEVREPLVTVNLGALDYPDLVAEIADLLLPYERAHWVLCVGHYRGEVFLSIRSDVPGARAGELIRTIVGTRGAAGGHGQIAGGKLHARVASDGELAAVHADLVERLSRALALPANVTPRPLLPRASL